jgi:hypothetical protein
MRLAQEAQVIPVIGSSTRSVWVVVAAVMALGGDVVAGVVDGGADSAVVDRGAGDRHALGIEVDDDGGDAGEPADLAGDRDARQCPQEMPGTEWKS